MKWKLDFSIQSCPIKIDHSQNIFLIGSCFTEHISVKLKDFKFNTLENPHGILFNPYSIQVAFDDYLENKQYTEKDVFELNGIWHSWFHHSQFSNIETAPLLHKINTRIQEAHHFLKKTDVVFITLGSAWVYELKQSKQFISNNHKAPDDWFQKKLLSHQEIENSIADIILKITQFNPNCFFIFTVSPVRHAREGLVENNLSKAHLIIAIQETIKKYPNTYYFPAYEIVIDELRDYRFYAEDMLHPNYQATQYVWEKLSNSIFSLNTVQVLERIKDIQLAVKHKPIVANSKQHTDFLKKYLEKTKLILQEYPALNFTKEIAYFTTSIKN